MFTCILLRMVALSPGIHRRQLDGSDRPQTALVDDPEYRRKLLRDMQKRRIPPAVEVMLWAYAKGRPAERIDIAMYSDLSALSDEEFRVELEKALLRFHQRGRASDSRRPRHFRLLG